MLGPKIGRKWGAFTEVPEPIQACFCPILCYVSPVLNPSSVKSQCMSSI